MIRAWADSANEIIELYETNNNATISVSAIRTSVIRMGSGTAALNGSVTIPLKIDIADPTGLGAATLNLTYNPSIAVVTNVVKGTDSFDSLTSSHPETNTSGYVRMAGFKTGATGVGPGIVTFANITFRATGATGSLSNLNVSVITFKNNTGVSIPYDVINGFITIGLKGDFSGDGIVDAWDATYLARHIAGLSRYAVIYSGDISGDGIVDIWDATYLARHLAGLHGYEELR